MSRPPGSGNDRSPGDRTEPIGELGLTATDLADAVYLAALCGNRTDARRREPPPGVAEAGFGGGADADDEDTAYGHRTGAIAGHAPDAEPPGTDGLPGHSGTGARADAGRTPVFTVYLPGDGEPAGSPGSGDSAASQGGVDGYTDGRSPLGPPGSGPAPGRGPGSGLDPGSAEGTGHPAEAPGHPVLEERQEFVAALGPFNLKTPQGPRDQLDLEGTARDYARALLDSLHWSEAEMEDSGVPVVPELRSRSRRSVDLTLLVDDGVTMLFQHDVVGEFSRLVRNSGVFRSVRELWFDSERPGPPGLGDARGRGRRLGPLARTGARVVLVLTDGLGGAWRDRAFQEWVAGVAERGAVAILHLLRPPLWRRGAIRTVPTELSVAWPATPGGANTGYVRERSITWADEDESEGGGGTVVPVLPLSPDAIHAWASFVMSRNRSRLWVHAVEFPVEETEAREDSAWEAQTSEDPEWVDLDRDVVEDAAEAVRRFHQTATPDAFELAVALAAVPLDPRLVGAVCEEVFGGPTPSELTEVFFSGLVLMEPPAPDPSGDGSVRWDFRAGVREALLSLGGRVQDIRRMLALAARRFGQVDPWFDDLDRMLRGQRVTSPKTTRTSHRWVNSMKPAMDSISLYRNYAEPIDVYANALPAHEAHHAQSPSDVDSPRAPGLQFPQGPGATPTVANGTRRPRSPAPSSALSGEKNNMSQNPSRGGMMNDPVDPPTAGSGRTRGRPLNAVWVQVPRRNTSFTGREELLSSLRAQLVKDQQQVITALNGMSGVGKTELAKEYLYRYASDYDLICWIPSGHGNQLRDAFASLAAKFGLDSAGAGSGHILQDVLEALRRGVPFQRWLLVFDNAQTRAELEQYLPVGGEGHVVITSRDSSWARRGGDTYLSVREFTRTESIDLLKRRGPASLTGAEADQLAEELGDLPLALNQAAVWLHESGMDTEEYLRQFANKSNEMLALLSPVDPDYPVPVAAAWNVSLDRLAMTNPAALQLLQLCSFLDTAPIPRSLFNFARQIDAPPELRQALDEPARLGMAIRDIGRNSLAHIDHQRNTISLHRLVQRAVQMPMNDEEREMMRHCAHQLLGRNDPQDGSVDAYPRYTQLVPHVWASEAWDCDDPWVRSLVIQLTRIALSGGEYDEAKRLATVAHEWWRRALGEEHRNTLHMALQISKAMREQGKLEEARELCGTTLATLREVHGPQAPEALEAEREQVRNLRTVGRFKDSLTEVADIYRERVRLFGEDDPLTLDMSHNLGYSLLLSGDPKASADRYRETLERMEAVLGPDDRSMIGTFNGYAEALMELGHYRESERYQAEVVQRCMEGQGPDGVGTLSNETVLAVMRRRVGDHHGAFALSEHAWQRFLAKRGVDNSYTLYAALIHTLSLSAVNRYDEALDLAEASGERYVKLLGEEHPHVVAASVNRGIILRRLGRAVEAQELDKRALMLFLDRIGPHHPSTLACRANLANDLFLTGDVAGARERDEETMEACLVELGDHHPLTLLARRNLLVDRTTQGEDTVEEFTTLEAAYRDVMGERHPATLSIRKTVRGDADIFLTQM